MVGTKTGVKQTNSSSRFILRHPKTRTELKKRTSWKPSGPFRFFDLPWELRRRIYELALLVPRTLDFEPTNYKRIAPRLRLLRTSRRIYEEAYPIFYGAHVFRLFPTHRDFFENKEPLLSTLPPKYRKTIKALELRLGPGWGSPPEHQNLRSSLGLKDCVSVKRLHCFIEIDPSNDVFRGYRVNDSFYTIFSSKLLDGVLQQVPSIRLVEFDAYPSVKKNEPLMTELLRVAKNAGKEITWGPQRGWGSNRGHDYGYDSLPQALASIDLREDSAVDGRLRM